MKRLILLAVSLILLTSVEPTMARRGHGGALTGGGGGGCLMNQSAQCILNQMGQQITP